MAVEIDLITFLRYKVSWFTAAMANAVVEQTKDLLWKSLHGHAAHSHVGNGGGGEWEFVTTRQNEI